MTANIFISGPIGFPPGEYAEDVGTTLNDVRRQLESFGEGVTKVNVFINSPGGDVVEGFAIYDYLRALPATVSTVGEGMVYSIASVIFAAGSERLLYENAELFLHDPIAGLYGNSRDMREAAEYLDSARDKIVNAYLQVAQDVNREEVIDLMAAETYLKADDAITLGFATGIYTRALEPVAYWRNPDNKNMSKDANQILNEIKQKLGLVKVSAAAEVAEPEQNKQPLEAEPETVTAPSIEDEITAKDEEIAALKAQIASLESEKENASEKVAELQAVVASNEQALKVVSEQIKELEEMTIAKPEPFVPAEAVNSLSNSLPEELLELDNRIYNKLKKFA